MVRLVPIHGIVAVDDKNGIGMNGRIPFRFRKDIKRFKNMTTDGNCAIIMGRGTWDSLPNEYKPLPSRLNIVVSNNKSLDLPNDVILANSIENAIFIGNNHSDIEKIWIIGGSSIYKYCMEHCIFDEIHVTRVFETFDCDRFFPKVNTKKYTLYQDSDVMSEMIQSFEPNITRYFKFESYRKSHPEHQYLDLIRDICTSGVDSNDRTGVGTKSVFGRELRFNLKDGIPVLTTKRVYWKGAKAELLWFLSGSTDNSVLQEQDVSIWDGNSTREFLDNRGLKSYDVGDIGPGYGFQWRHWGAKYEGKDADYTGKGTDQIQQCIDTIKKNPNSRRIILSAWNVSDLGCMALPPCHMQCQFYVRNGALSCKMTQRSVDTMLGLPFNIASYALLTYMMAQVCDLDVGDLIISTGDTHIYMNHMNGAHEQINRSPRKLPTLWLNPDVKNINEFNMKDIKLKGYKCHPKIKMDMAV
jgi:dihydrofolate reductase/thymidylate synthase